MRTAVLALDDLYLPRAQRERRARQEHPLFRTRGPPGTHDVALGLALLDRLRARDATELPVFDKATDDRAPEPRRFDGPAAAVILEGWCVGARAQTPAELAAPLNALERDEDADGCWRAAVNAELAGGYARLWAACDRHVRLLAPDWPTVRRWRREAEAQLRARTGGGMGDAELDRFLQHYERLTRALARDAAPVDLLVPLGPDRAPRCRPVMTRRPPSL